MTYKCCALRRRSRPGLPWSSETGIVPSSWFSARSSQSIFDRLPRERGIVPLNLLELSALHEKATHSLP